MSDLAPDSHSTATDEIPENIDTPDGVHLCPRCKALVSNVRYELLGVLECPACTPQKAPPIGVWDYPEGFHERNEGVGGLIVLE